LHPQILAASEGIIVSRETDPAELKALFHLRKPQLAEEEVARRLGTLALREAILFPGIEEACGGLCTFTVAPRLSAHVRHSHKYFDVPVPAERAFVFTDVHPEARARTLKEFIQAVSGLDIRPLQGYLERHDFSRWIDQVFGDYILSAQIEKLETQNGKRHADATRSEIVRLIEDRYTIGLSGQEEGSDREPALLTSRAMSCQLLEDQRNTVSAPSGRAFFAELRGTPISGP
jgi:hypothetical protein